MAVLAGPVAAPAPHPSFSPFSTLLPTAPNTGLGVPGIKPPFATATAPKAAPKPAAKATGFDATATQKFLNAKGYSIPVDGINGPLTQAAAAAFRSHADPAAFNVGHGLTTAAPAATPSVPAPAAKVKAPAAKPIAGRNASAGFSSDTGSGSSATGSSDSGTGSSGGSSGSTGTSTPATGTSAAQASIAAILAPIIKQIQDASLTSGRQGQSLINGYTTSAENELKGIDFGAPYTQAGNDQNAINTALLSLLQGSGSGLQDQLGTTLAAAGQSPTLSASLQGKIGADTAGAAGANLAKGDASLSQLNQEGAAAKTYGNKLPGITALGGLQDTKGLQGQVQTDENNQLQALQAKVPGLVQTELNSQATAAQNAAKNNLTQEQIDTSRQKTLIAATLANGVDPKTGVLTPAASAVLSKITGAPAGTFTGLSAKDALTASNDATKNNLTQQGLDIKKTQINDTWATNQQKIKFGYDKLSADNKVSLAKLAQGDKKLALQAAVAQNKASQMSPDSYTKLLQSAHTQADNFYYGIPAKVDSYGTTTVPAVGPVQYPQALSQLLSQHVKLSDALNILNAFYAPGEGGRPKTTAAK